MSSHKSCVLTCKTVVNNKTLGETNRNGMEFRFRSVMIYIYREREAAKQQGSEAARWLGSKAAGQHGSKATRQQDKAQQAEAADYLPI